jgi:effector-binding domain-containing protein
MPTFFCAYHGQRPAMIDAAGQSICSACADLIEGRAISPLTDWTPLAPLIVDARPTGVFEPGEIDFVLSPAQELLATEYSPLLPVDDVYALIPRHIQTLERAMTQNKIAPLGPLLLLYDHPDIKDFAHVRFSAAYPVPPETLAPAEKKIPLEVRHLPAMRIAQIQFAGPWSQLYVAYPPLRKAILASRVGFGPLTIERYLIPRGTNSETNLTLIQRQLAD